MSINFAAVHDRKRWRKHRSHKTLDAAIDGKDGAKNLLDKIGRVAEMWTKYGEVRCVFVWEDDSATGRALRLSPDGSSRIQSERVTIDSLLRFDTNKGCSDQEIDECFEAKSGPDQANVEAYVKHSTPDAGSLFPDELPEGGNYIEGLAQGVLVNRYERSLSASLTTGVFARSVRWTSVNDMALLERVSYMSTIVSRSLQLAPPTALTLSQTLCLCAQTVMPCSIGENLRLK